MAKAKTPKAPPRRVRRAKAAITKKAVKARTKPPLKKATKDDEVSGSKGKVSSVQAKGSKPVQPVKGARHVRELPVLLPGHRGAGEVVGPVSEESAGPEDGSGGGPGHSISGTVVAGSAPSVLVRGIPEDKMVAQEQPSMNDPPATIRKPKATPGVTIHAKMPTKKEGAAQATKRGLDGISPAGGKPYRNIKVKPWAALVIADNGDQHPISYREGYKYQTDVDFTMPTGIHPDSTISNGFLHLNVAGILTIKAGYAWDGATGAVWTKSIRRGSLVHDALYQLMRQKKLHAHRRERIDMLFRDICLADGMWRARAWWVYRGVRRLAGFAADPKNAKKVIVAP